MKTKFILNFWVLIILAACDDIEKEKEDDSKLLYSLIALPHPPDRAENYDRDVKIVTHTEGDFRFLVV